MAEFIWSLRESWFCDRVLDDGFLAVAAGRIARIGFGAAPEARQTVDAAGNYVLPGAIDGQVHAGSPSRRKVSWAPPGRRRPAASPPSSTCPMTTPVRLWMPMPSVPRWPSSKKRRTSTSASMRRSARKTAFRRFPAWSRPAPAPSVLDLEAIRHVSRAQG